MPINAAFKPYTFLASSQKHSFGTLAGGAASDELLARRLQDEEQEQATEEEGGRRRKGRPARKMSVRHVPATPSQGAQVAHPGGLQPASPRPCPALVQPAHSPAMTACKELQHCWNTGMAVELQVCCLPAHL